MLAAGREPEFLRSRGAQPQHPVGQPLRVEQLAGVRGARHGLEMRVAGILVIEPAQGSFEAGRIPGLNSQSQPWSYGKSAL